MRNWVLVMAMALGLVACDKPKDRVPLNWKPEDVSLQCPSGDCPPGTGLLIFLNREARAYRVLHCSGTLISENTILTNDHCDFTTKPNTKGYFFTREEGRTIFMGISGELFKAKGKISGLDRDLAILKLAGNMKLPPRKISRKIPPNMDHLVSFVANRQRFGSYSLDKLNCRTKEKMALYGGGISENHTGLGLFDCPVIRGNSGAALFTPDNLDEIQVVINTLWKFEKGISEGSAANSLFLEEPDYLSSGFAMGERVHCQDIKGQADPHTKCAPVDFERTMGDPFRAAVTKEIQRRIQGETADSDVVWTTQVFSVQAKRGGRAIPAVILAPQPHCVRGHTGKIQELKFTYLKIGLLKNGTAGTKLLAEDRMRVSVDGTESGNVRLTFNVIPEAKDGDYIFMPRERFKYSSLAKPGNYHRLPECDAKSAEEAAAISLKNVSSIKVDDRVEN